MGASLTRQLILKTDPDNATAKGYAAMFRCTAAERTAIHRKADQAGNNAFVFWSTRRKEAKTEAMAFLDSKGYRVRPSGG